MNILNKIKLLFKSKNKKDLILNYFGLKESYSQNGEDIILKTYFKNNYKGFYVDIGANHPTKLNNFYLFYKKGWSGINVEPNISLYNQLLRKRPKDINLNIGIGSGEKIKFFVIDNHTLSTFDGKTADEYKKMGHRIVGENEIQTKTLENIFDEYIKNKKIDILSVDVEGFDMEVLKSNNWTKYKPEYILLETLEYKKDGTGKKTNHLFDGYLFEKGYERIADTYINTIYKLSK